MTNTVRERRPLSTQNNNAQPQSFLNMRPPTREEQQRDYEKAQKLEKIAFKVLSICLIIEAFVLVIAALNKLFNKSEAGENGVETMFLLFAASQALLLIPTLLSSSMILCSALMKKLAFRNDVYSVVEIVERQQPPQNNEGTLLSLNFIRNN